MSQNLRDFTTAVYGFDAVVARMPDDAWDSPSACEGWSARDLLQHQCAVLNGVTACAASGAMARPTPPEDVSDPQAVWKACRTELLATLDGQGVLHQQGPFWFDTPTIDDMIGFVTWDPLAHSWDLAQAAGLEACIDADVAAKIVAQITPMQDMLVESGRIGTPVEVAADADAVTQFLGATGRNPAAPA